MKLEVIQFTPLAQEDVQDVIDLLEEILADARAGKYTQLAIAGVYTNGGGSTFRQATRFLSPTLLGAVEMLGYAIKTSLYEKSEKL